MPNKVITNDLPRSVREGVTSKVRVALSEAQGEWTASIKVDPLNHAWDVEIRGPRRSHWERRFSGEDRDAEVIAAAIRQATGTGSDARDLNDALSELAMQGIAFLNKTDGSAEPLYVVDRVELKESEIVYLHKQGALTRRGIQRYLLNRTAA